MINKDSIKLKGIKLNYDKYKKIIIDYLKELKDAYILLYNRFSTKSKILYYSILKYLVKDKAKIDQKIWKLGRKVNKEYTTYKKKKDKYDREGKGSLNASTLEAIVPTSIILVFIILTCIFVINQIIGQNIVETGIDNIQDKIWEQAFLDAEKKKVGIKFYPINTTLSEYESLRLQCNKFIEQEDEGKDVDATLNVQTTIDEEQYIDESRLTPSTGIFEQDIMAETGPIYFQDMLMIRYVDTDGRLKVITGMYEANKEDITVVRQSKLIEAVDRISKDKEELGIQTFEDTEKPSDGSTWTPEADYLHDISRILNNMLLATKKSEKHKAEKEALRYFTADGNKTVFGNKRDINLVNNAEIETYYIVAGKSDPNKAYKDRIYTQITILINGETFVENIILKLNDNLKIYDIDII